MIFFRSDKSRRTVLFNIFIVSSIFTFFSCKQTIDSIATPHIIGGSSVSRELCPPTEIRASQGLKRKIRLDWTLVNNAKRYEIYFSENPTKEFKKIAETDRNYYEDIVGAGSSYYYKIRSESASGELSNFSNACKGTSLAVPLLISGDYSESSATIYWHMENARDSATREDNYESKLNFTVTCIKDGASENDANAEISDVCYGNQNSYTFTGLDASSTYTFSVSSYLITEQTATETSPSVSMVTLHSYIPLSPEVTATEGEYKDKVELSIRLPQKVKVNTTTEMSPNERVDEDYPLLFKIYRKSSTVNDYPSDPLAIIYYDGNTTPPSNYDNYLAGNKILWTDNYDENNENSLKRGEKYDYMVRSFVDTNFSAEIGSTYNATVGAKEGTIVTAWASAVPRLSISEIEYEKTTKPVLIDPNNPSNLEEEEVYGTASFNFNLAWTDLGKASLYKFAVEQTRKLFEIDNGNDEDTVGTTTWIQNTGKTFFDTVSELNNHLMQINLLQSRGYYTYTLYIVPVSAQNLDEGKTNALDFVTSRQITLSDEIDKPISEILRTTSGYSDKVDITFKIEEGKTYYLERKNLDTNTLLTIHINLDTNTITKGEETDSEGNKYSIATYTDKDITPGTAYEYVLFARGYSFATDSEPMQATTLGKPDPRIGALSYDKIVVTLKAVREAVMYGITIGEENKFGNGETSIFSPDIGSLTNNNIEYDEINDTFTITYENPFGYNDANLAGTPITVIVYAMSENGYDYIAENFVEGRFVNTEVNNVKVLGPAKIDAKVGDFADATEDSLTLTWKKINGAKGYLIRRVKYTNTAMTEYDSHETDTYYYDEEKRILKVNGFEIKENRATVTLADDTYTLTDYYAEPDSDIDTNIDKYDISDYQKTQSKIALGLPYNYMVLPVLDENDFKFENKFGIKDTSKVSYHYLEPTKGVATFGYGLRVKAAKAESAGVQNIEWEKPFYGDKLKPVLSKRAFDSTRTETGGWEKINLSNENAVEFSRNLSGNEVYKATEYAVKYQTNTSQSNYAPSYEVYLKETLENRYDYGTRAKEPLNKGYLLSSSYTAEYGGTTGSDGKYVKDANYYSETVWIDAWDYTERALAPTKYEIQVLSLDLSAGWTTVAEFDSNLTLTTKNVTDTTIVQYNDIGVRLSPTGITNGTASTTNGPLKILRSAKHYYAIKLTNDFTTTEIKNNYQTYAYRQITDEEIVKSTMLVVSSILSDADIGNKGKTGGGGEDTYGYTNANTSGQFGWNQSWQSEFKWYFNDFHYGWADLPCGKSIYENFEEYYPSTKKVKNFFKITDTNSLATRGRKYSLSLIYLCNGVYGKGKFDSSKKNPVTVVFEQDDKNKELDSYNPTTVNFAIDVAGNKFYANCNGTNFEDTEDIKYWFPASCTKESNIGIAGSSTTFFCKDATYGWWN